jgi:hypothetical protein
MTSATAMGINVHHLEESTGIVGLLHLFFEPDVR